MKYTLALLPVWSSPAATAGAAAGLTAGLPFYRALRSGGNVSRRNGGAIEVIGMEIGQEGKLFDAVLLEVLSVVYHPLPGPVVMSATAFWLYAGGVFHF